MINAVINTDVLIIGAGPSGAIAAANMHRLGHQVLVLERQVFPRFTIGESLLPHCMEYIEEAGLLAAVNNYGFQFKNGAAFARGSERSHYNFEQKFSKGPGTTFQVDRGEFDKLLADEVAAQGVDIRYSHTIIDVDTSGEKNRVRYTDAEGREGIVECQFILDASGFGRVLPRLLNLEKPSNFPIRQAISTHIVDHISDPNYDRNKILVTVHPHNKEIWFWLIPFSDGRCSMGVIATPEQVAARAGNSLEERLKTFISEAPEFEKLIANAEFCFPFRELVGYSAKVTHLAEEKFALLGNAGEFLDPVFSSGITIAMRSASSASHLLDRQLKGGKVNWLEEYEKPLRQGIDTFRVFVEAWYDGRFQDIIFFNQQTDQVRDMISAILAGYAWDTQNPYVAEPLRRVNTLAEYCRLESAVTA